MRRKQTRTTFYKDRYSRSVLFSEITKRQPQSRRAHRLCRANVYWNPLAFRSTSKTNTQNFDIMWWTPTFHDHDTLLAIPIIIFTVSNTRRKDQVQVRIWFSKIEGWRSIQRFKYSCVPYHHCLTIHQNHPLLPLRGETDSSADLKVITLRVPLLSESFWIRTSCDPASTP